MTYNSVQDILKIIYNSVFGLGLLFACQLWGQKNYVTANKPNPNTSGLLKR